MYLPSRLIPLITATLLTLGIVSAANSAGHAGPLAVGAQAGGSRAGIDWRINTTLVLIPVSVTDRANRSITGLRREAFRLFEGDREQPILHFSSDDAPLSAGIVFDTSGSMRNKLKQSRAAVAAFLNTANPEDEFFLVDFSSQARLSVPFTMDPTQLQDRLRATAASGRTALLDAVYLALQYMKKARNPRKVLLVISDGGDNDSRYTESEIARLVRESDVWIYAIGLHQSGARALGEDELAGPRLLEDLAEQTGGKHFAVRSVAELPELTEQIGLELRNQYLLGYRPPGGLADGRYHRVKVKLVQPKGRHVSSRPGYYAPEQ